MAGKYMDEAYSERVTGLVGIEINIQEFAPSFAFIGVVIDLTSPIVFSGWLYSNQVALLV